MTSQDMKEVSTHYRGLGASMQVLAIELVITMEIIVIKNKMLPFPMSLDFLKAYVI